MIHIKSIHITTYQQSTWGRVYVCFEKDNQLFYAFKNFLDFKEINYIGDGNIENEPAFTWFERNRRFTFSLDEVLSGNADHLFLTPEKWKIQCGTPSILLKRLLIDIYSNNLTPVTHRRGWFSHHYIPTLHSSDLNITKEYNQIVLVDYCKELDLEPLMKTLYILHLKHPEGIVRKQIGLYEKEIEEIYMQITNKSDLEKVKTSLKSLIDLESKSFDEKISKIKKIITDLLGEKLAYNYIISKSETDHYTIKLSQDKIFFD